MGMIQPLIDYKDKVIEAILTSEEIVRMIGNPKCTTVPALGLKYQNVYPYAYVPDTKDEASNIICVEANIYQVNTDAVCDIELFVWVLCHISQVKTEYGTRQDVIADLIDERLNHSEDFGIGVLTPASRDTTAYSIPNYDYVCRKVTYLAKDYNYRYGYHRDDTA